MEKNQKNPKFSLTELIEFGYYARNNAKTPMRKNYHNWIKEKNKDLQIETNSLEFLKGFNIKVYESDYVDEPKILIPFGLINKINNNETK